MRETENGCVSDGESTRVSLCARVCLCMIGEERERERERGRERERERERGEGWDVVKILKCD